MIQYEYKVILKKKSTLRTATKFSTPAHVQGLAETLLALTGLTLIECEYVGPIDTDAIQPTELELEQKSHDAEILRLAQALEMPLGKEFTIEDLVKEIRALKSKESTLSQM